MNYLLSVIVVVICSLIGFTISGEYVKRYKFYKSLHEFALYLKININFSQATLRQNFDSYTGNEKFKDFLNTILVFIENEQLTIEELQKIMPVKMSGEEIGEIFQFFESLGKSDNESQIEFLNGYIEKFKTKTNVAEEEKNKNSNAYSKLGVGVGLIIAIIII